MEENLENPENPENLKNPENPKKERNLKNPKNNNSFFYKILLVKKPTIL